MRGKRFLYSFQIPLRQDHVRVEHNQPFAVGTFGSIVTALARATVFLQVIMQIKDVCVLVANILARFLTSVLNNDDLEVLKRLMCQAFEQFVHFIGTIEDGNDD